MNGTDPDVLISGVLGLTGESYETEHVIKGDKYCTRNTAAAELYKVASVTPTGIGPDNRCPGGPCSFLSLCIRLPLLYQTFKASLPGIRASNWRSWFFSLAARMQPTERSVSFFLLDRT